MSTVVSWHCLRSKSYTPRQNLFSGALKKSSPLPILIIQPELKLWMENNSMESFQGEINKLDNNAAWKTDSYWFESMIKILSYSFDFN